MKLFGSRKALSGLALCGAVMLSGVAGFAQQQTTTQGQDGQQREGRRGGRKGWGGKRGGLMGGFAKDLNLTDAQKEQMRQIAERYRESTKALRQQMRTARGDRAGSANGTFDEAAVRAAAQARANASVELEVAHARMRSEMYNVLTAEQKAQMAARRQQWEQKRQERRARRNQSQGQTEQ